MLESWQHRCWGKECVLGLCERLWCWLVHLQTDHLHLLVSRPLPLSSCLPATLTSGSQDCFYLGVAAVSEAVCFVQQRTERHEQTWTPCWQIHAGASCKHCVFCCLLRAASLEEPAVKPGMLLNTTEDLFAPSPIPVPRWTQTVRSPRTAVMPTRAKLLAAGECHLLLPNFSQSSFLPRVLWSGESKSCSEQSNLLCRWGRDVAILAWELSLLCRGSSVLMALSHFPFQAPPHFSLTLSLMNINSALSPFMCHAFSHLSWCKFNVVFLKKWNILHVIPRAGHLPWRPSEVVTRCHPMTLFSSLVEALLDCNGGQETQPLFTLLVVPLILNSLPHSFLVSFVCPLFPSNLQLFRFLFVFLFQVHFIYINYLWFRNSKQKDIIIWN